ncbi:hypothetical protein [Limimaricola sp.]|uniref:hypothetical protein n=1 Tax=Limimaricola sp. TaxID=2211665 RepID=UPI00405A0D0A
METILGKGLNDLANLVSEKWYAGMGLTGLMILLGLLLFDTPHDTIIVGAIAVSLIGIGFGEGECRTFQKIVDGDYIYTRPVRRMNGPGFTLYLLGTIGLIVAVARGWALYG